MKIFDKLKDKARSTGDFVVDKSKRGLEELDRIKSKQEKDNRFNDDFLDEGLPLDLEDMDKDIFDSGSIDNYDVGLPPTQKPASFFHFILENQFRDIEMAIRGYKEIRDKQTQKWKIVRKESHCFTDEEAENIVRLIQSHLSPDIKLGILHPDAYKITMIDIGNRLMKYFRSIMHYQFGRFKESEQIKMKEDALNILQAILSRIKMNYSRAVGGKENRYTHDSVKGQESLQGEYNKDKLDFSY